MWKISRNIIFSRLSKKQQYGETNSKPPPLSKTVSSFPSAEKKNYSDEDYKKQHFKKNEGFWNCKNLRFLLFKSSILEKAGWLGTVTVLCLNFHFKHMQFINDYKRGKSHCLLSKNVLAMPNDVKKEKDNLPNQQADYTFSCSDEKSEQITTELNILEDLKKLKVQYTAAVHNSSGISNLQKNMKKAFRSFQAGARLGSSQAFYNLGLCYELGKGTKVNLTRAAFCYKKAAIKGHALASFNLAVYFLKGLGGLPIDIEVAKQLMAQAAEKDIPEAQLYIGLDYLEQAKYSEAFQMFNTLAEKNILDGKYYLGVCYENGWGVSRDEKIAFGIFTHIAGSGHSKSILKLSKYYEEGLGGCEPDLDFSIALCQMLTDQTSEDYTTTLLRLKIKKALKCHKKMLAEQMPLLITTEKSIHCSISVPELMLYRKEKCKTKTEVLAAQSYLGLITPLLPIQTNTVDSGKRVFHVENEKLDSRLAGSLVPYLQINMSRLMAAKS